MIKQLNSATPLELDQIMTIWFNGNLAGHPFINRQYWLDNWDYVRNELPKAEIVVAQVNDQIQGFVGVMDNYIAGIFVAAKYRHQGLGQQLLDYIKQDHQSLTLNVYELNQVAVHFYQRQNFQVMNKELDTATNQVELTMSWSAAI